MQGSSTRCSSAEPTLVIKTGTDSSLSPRAKGGPDQPTRFPGLESVYATRGQETT
jgi:hypothetical protein